MWSGMEILSPASSFLFGGGRGRSAAAHWTHEENEQFENALALVDEGTPDRWQKVASMISGKTADDVFRHYQVLENDVSHIEAGLFPPPPYGAAPFTMYAPAGRPGAARPAEQERKKGVPWTEEEHKKFLMGLKKYGKGDWRNISRNFVTTRTPTQVASHAQKYFIRLGSAGKDKRRSSIHDITTANMSETAPPPPAGKPSAAHNPPAAASPNHAVKFESTEGSAARGGQRDSLFRAM
ncbi:transcription factor DIVARICATA-like [Wolffia australiana]